MTLERRRLLELFVFEAREHLRGAYDLLQRMERDPAGDPPREQLMRHCHSLKGMAATLGLRSTVRVAHRLEDLVARLPTPAAPSVLADLRDGLGAIGTAIDRAENGEEATEVEAAAHRWRLTLHIARPAVSRTSPTVRVLRELGELGRVEQVDPPRLGGDPPRFDGRLCLVLGCAIDRRALEDRLGEVPGIEAFRVRPEPAASDLPRRERRPMASMRVRSDLMDVALDRLLDLILEHGRARVAPEPARRQHAERAGFLLRELYATMTELRLVAFDSIAEKLHRTVHELAGELGKNVRFLLQGGDVRADRAVLEALLEPLQHVVRNALDHGIEDPEERLERGKPPQATLRLTLERRAERIRIAVADDGRGLDAERLRRAAVAGGLLTPRGAEACSERDLWALITRPSLSTSPQITEVSGRGVGMHVVRQTVDRLGGRLQVRSRPGEGTSVLLDLPASQELITALLVRSAGELFALPIALLRHTAHVGRDRELPAEVLRLDRELGLPNAGAGGADRDRAILALTLGQRGVEVLVDELVGRREIVVRPLHEPLSALRQYSGATLLEDGQVVLILDPRQFRSVAERHAELAAPCTRA